jgi:hypothetical protein
LFPSHLPGRSIIAGPAWFRATWIEADLSIKRRRSILMRRASTCLAVLSLGILSLPGAASAAPTVTFKLTAIPIPGYPHTGNILGAGAAGLFEFTIKGTEYDEGHPAPLIGVKVTFPSGTKIHPQGFKACTKASLEKLGEKAIGTASCPKQSLLTFPESAPQPESPSTFLSKESYARGVVRFGKEVAEEKSRVDGFFAPGGGLYFFSKGVTPASFEIISPGTVTVGGSPATNTTVPLVETVPGAADASVEKIVVYAGAAYKKGGKTVYYATAPKKCPKGGFPVKAELTFANPEALPAPVPGAKVEVDYKAPCPRK